jgi:hypothetical protein
MMKPYRFLTGLAIAILTISTQSSAQKVIGQTTAIPRFSDTKRDLYAEEIEKAATQKIMVGFEDNRFRPQALITREQVVSIVVEALKQAPLKNDNLPFPSPEPPPLPAVPTQVNRNPFPDVDKNRWSAAKIQYARDLDILRGYSDGNFRSTQAVTRAELVVILQQAYRYLVKLRGWDGRDAFVGDEPYDFSDTQTHWARDVIRNMSANCRAAAPLNETGKAFAPDRAAQRNYAAAALIRTAQCWSIPARPPS